ncbi:substrate-binding domain-containing protein [Alsobacter sp. R-9]
MTLGTGQAMAKMTCLSSMATRRILADLAARFEASGGGTVAVESTGGVDAARRVREGEVVDVVVLASPVMQALEAEGRLLPGSRVDLAESETVIAVRAGLPHPDLATVPALRASLLEAGAVAYSTGPSGDHFLSLLERWGLMPALQDRLVKAPPGVPVGTLVAEGKASLGLQQRSELAGLPGIEIVAALPPGAAATTVFTAGIAAAAPDPGAARRFIAFLASPSSAEVYVGCGMRPLAGPA